MKRFLKVVAPALMVGLFFTGCTEQPTNELNEADLVRLVFQSFDEEGGAKPQEVKCPDPLPKVEGEIVKCTLITADGKPDTISVAAQVVEGNDIWVSVGDTAEDMERKAAEKEEAEKNKDS